MWIQSSKTDQYLEYQNNQTGEVSRWSRIYFHNELGVFYAIDNVLQLPYQRKYLFDLAQQMERIGMEKDELSNKMQEIMTLCRDKKEGFELDIYSIAQGVERYMKDVWDYQKTALMVVALIVIQDGEQIGFFDQQQAEQKINKWMKDKEMLGFFLSIASQRISPVNSSFGQFTQMFSEKANQYRESQP